MQQVRAVLARLHQPGVPRDECVQLERQIEAWRTHPDAWQAVGEFVVSEDQHERWFAASVFQHVVDKRWTSLGPEVRAQVRSAMLAAVQATPHAMVQSKLSNSLVRSAAWDWPDQWPSFLSDVHQLVLSRTSTALGLELLRNVGEEFASGTTATSAVLTSARRRQLRDAFLPQLRDVFALLTSVLDASGPPGRRYSDFDALPGSPIAARGRSATWPETSAARDQRLALQALQSFLAWVPLNGVLVSPRLLRLLFHHAAIHPSIALPCLNELMLRKCFPTDLDDFISILVDGSAQLLAAEPSIPGTIDFIACFLASHLQRIGDNLPLLLSRLLQYTFAQSSADDVRACLTDVWDLILAELPDPMRHLDVFHALFAQLPARALFMYQWPGLSYLSVDVEHGEDKSELQCYLDTVMDTALTLLQLQPVALLPEVYRLLSTAVEAYVAAGAAVPAELCYDVASVLRLLAGVASVFHADFDQHAQNAALIYQRILELGGLIFAEQRLTDTASGALHGRVVTAVFATMQSFAPWLTLAAERFTGADRESMQSLVSGTCEQIAASLDMQYDPRSLATDAALRLLRDLGPLARGQAHVDAVVARALYIAQPLRVPLQQQLYRALACVVAPSAIPELCASFLSAFTQLVASRADEADGGNGGEDTTIDRRAFAHANVVHRVCAGLQVASSLVQDARERSAAHRDGVHAAVAPTIPVALRIIGVLGNEVPPVVEQLLVYFLELFRTFGPSYLSQDVCDATIHAWLSLFSGQQLRAVLLAAQDRQTVRVLCRFFELLTFIVQRRSSTFAMLLPSIVALCQVLHTQLVGRNAPPAADADDAPPSVIPTEVQRVFFHLLHETLQAHWRYLARGPRPELLTMLHSVLRSFQQYDLVLFEENLSALQALAQTHRVYAQEWFPRDAFLETLLSAMVDRSHASLRDAIVAVVYDLAQVDFASFYRTLLPALVQSSTRITPEQQSALLLPLAAEPTDIPSFTFCIVDLVNDFAHYSDVNAVAA